VIDPVHPILIDALNPGPMTGRGNHTYLIVGSGQATLIDAGTGEAGHLSALDRHVAEAHVRLTRVLVTHAHPDHASGAAAVEAAHPGVVFAKYPWPDEDSRYRVAWTPLADQDAVEVGADRLVAIHTPGHSPDHLAFWHPPSRTLFAGDLVQQGGSVMIPWKHGGDLGLYLQSLERLVALVPRRLLPAHGPEPSDPVGLLTSHLDHRRQRERQVLAALASGRDSVQAIAETIYDGLDSRLLPAAHDTVRAHLEKLKSEGRVLEDNARWML
jgi:glyoxylase-like metal-dependent hydrolase (beta-lactamase superfamily II)